ncbi:MAG: hypothetical protein OXF25_08775 [Cyanobacteria bacterium MAG CAR3_bin_5]|nr:hypothetical protein [Cyanobacteria bacterium MAG CAR3_bin_5]MCY4235728.1 hypothetical protein [Cyanobacteria bacterium MAG CAR2_bin_4]
MILTQSEADALIKLKKRPKNDDPIDLPDMGGKIGVPLVSLDKKESFDLDIRRGRIDLRKGTSQLRTQQIVILLRLDYNGSPHRNPDGSEIGCSHLHVYREGYADKWAYELPDGVFSDLNDHWQTLQDFLQYCSVQNTSNFRRGLFT